MTPLLIMLGCIALACALTRTRCHLTQFHNGLGVDHSIIVHKKHEKTNSTKMKEYCKFITWANHYD
jgi:hypothetical protein